MAWLLFIVTAPGLIVNPAMAAGTQYWDKNAETWDVSTSNWSPNLDGGSLTIWSDSNDAVFSAGTGHSGTFTVTVSDTRQANSITIEEGTLTFSGGTALQIGTGGLTLNSSAGAVTISSPITLGGSQSWENNSANTLTVNGAITSGGNTLTKAGTGTVTIQNATLPSFDTVNLSGGTLKLNTLPTSVPTVASGTRGFWLDASTLSGADNSTVSSWNWVNSSDGTAAMTLVNSPKLRTGANGMGTGQLPVVRFTSGYAYGSFAQTGSQSTTFVVVREPTVNGGSVGLITAAKTGTGLSDYNNKYTYTLRSRERIDFQGTRPCLGHLRRRSRRRLAAPSTQRRVCTR
jgi:hypothetical protein